MSDEHFDRSFLAKDGKEAHGATMELRDRIARLEASFDWMKVIMTLNVAVALGGFTFLGNQMMRLEGRMDRMETKLEAKIDAIPARLSEEFRAMRAEMAAQTTAIASSVTAARAVQPQIVVMPPR
jgi:hypothetical protein